MGFFFFENMIKTKIIILHKAYWKESSFLIKALSLDIGVIDCIAQGGRKPKSPYFSHFELGNSLEVVLYKRESAGLYKVTDSTIIRCFRSQSYEQLLSAQVGLETIGQLIITDDEAEQVFTLLNNYLEYVPNVKSNHHLVIWRMLIKLFYLLGFPIVQSYNGKYRLVDNECFNNSYHAGPMSPSPVNKDFMENIEKCLAILPITSTYIDKPMILKDCYTSMNKLLFDWIESHIDKKLHRNALDIFSKVL